MHGERLSTDIYKTYTKSGKFIDYIVWPVLYLYQGGNILSKGVAQGMDEVASDDIIVSMEEDKALENIDSDLEKSKDNNIMMSASSNDDLMLGNGQSLSTESVPGKNENCSGNGDDSTEIYHF
jgi:hypothetical protein